jgi:hypothetical protein
MKKLLILTILALFGMAFSPQNDIEAIKQAFKSGNADEVAKYFDDYVDIKLLDKDEVKNIGRNQASIALKSFFSENGVKGFQKISDREIGTTMYMTGKLLNGSKGYNITVMMKQKGGKHVIITIRIN